MSFAADTDAQVAPPVSIEPSPAGWARLPDLPDPIGVAGAFAGQIDGDLIVAGGANFPKGPPWRGGQKACHDMVYVLPKGTDRWITSDSRLPRPLSYGLSIPVDHGLILIGGCDTERPFTKVYRARITPGHTVRFEPLPPLPRPLAYTAGARLGSRIFVAGGQESLAEPRAASHFYCLDLSKEGSADFAWADLPTWPGEPRIVAAACAIDAGPDSGFYLFSGRNVSPGQPPRPLTDAYRFLPSENRWEALPPSPHCLMAAAALPSPDGRSILLLGGDDGKIFSALEKLRREIAGAPDAVTRDSLNPTLSRQLDEHPGFSRDIVRYDPRSRRYTLLKNGMPHPSPVTATAFYSGDRIVIPSGEIRPGTRSPAVWIGKPVP
jgi:N-acetylneuraminic acid mutarotase